MSLFSGDCTELAPCSVPVQHIGQIGSYGEQQQGTASTTSTATTTTSALVHPPQSRKSSTATAIENADGSGTGEQEGLQGKDGQRTETENGTGNTTANGGEHERGGDGEHEGGEDDAKITPAPSSVTRCVKRLQVVIAMELIMCNSHSNTKSCTLQLICSTVKKLNIYKNIDTKLESAL